MKTATGRAPWWTFMWGFLRAPRCVGAITPSSPWLVEALLETARIERAQTVVELGSGTGAVTDEIIRRLPTGARLVALELDEHFAANLRARIRDSRVTIITACAADAAQHLTALGVHSVDCIVSSLPLTSLPRPLTERILKAAAGLLQPGGLFVTYQFSAVVRPLLQDNFATVEGDRRVLRNFPPAIVFACRKANEASHRRPTTAVSAPHY